MRRFGVGLCVTGAIVRGLTSIALGRVRRDVRATERSPKLLEVLDKREVKPEADEGFAVAEVGLGHGEGEAALHLEFEFLHAGAQGDRGLQKGARLVGFGGDASDEVAVMIDKTQTRGEAGVKKC